MHDAESIEKAARSNLQIKIIIEKISREELFGFFIEQVKKNNFLAVSYILNTCFNTAEERANFGNKRHDAGNTAYHYAAQLGHDEIIIILNDKRQFKGEQKFFSFVELNHEGKTPLQLICENPKLSTFKLIWQRAGKLNHNPCYAIESARMGGNAEMIAAILQHPKFPKKSSASKGLKRYALHPEKKSALKKPHVDDKEESYGKRSNAK